MGKTAPEAKRQSTVVILFLASWLLCVCSHWDIEETLQEIQLQDPRKNNNKALGCWPPVHVVIVWLQKEKVSHFPHAGKVVVSPHVEDVVLYLSCTFLWDRKWNKERGPPYPPSGFTWVLSSTKLSYLEVEQFIHRILWYVISWLL